MTIRCLEIRKNADDQTMRTANETHGNASPRIDALMQDVVCVRGRRPIAACTGPLIPSRENMVPLRKVIGRITRLLNRFRVRWEFASIPDTTPSNPYIRQENTTISTAHGPSRPFAKYVI